MFVWIIRVQNDDVAQESVLCLMTCAISSQLCLQSTASHVVVFNPKMYPRMLASCEFELSMLGGSTAVLLKFRVCPKKRFASPKLAVFFSQCCNSEKKTHSTMESILFVFFTH